MEESLQNEKYELTSEITDISNSIFFKEGEVKNLKVKLEEKRELLRKITNDLINICDHVWETDFIDSMKGYKLAIPIRYCKKCELTDCTTFET